MQGSAKRVNYYQGRLLTADDLRQEQEYHIGKRRLLNRCLHGAGVACGLNVQLRGQAVQVEPGLALDCSGREICVPETIALDIPAFEGSQYVLLSYREEAVDPVPAPRGGDAVHAYILESYALLWGTDNPMVQHAERNGTWACCNRDHALPLARLSARRGAVRLDDAFLVTRVGR